MSENNSEKRYKGMPEIPTELRAGKTYFIVGIIGLLITSAIVVIAVVDQTDLWGKLFLTVLFGFLSVSTLMIYLVSRLYVDEERIEYKNMIGIKRNLLWRDIKKVYYTSGQSGLVFDNGYEKIKIGFHFQGVERLDTLIEKHFPDSFSVQSELATKRPGVSVEKNSITFRRKRYYAVFGTLILVSAIAFRFFLYSKAESILLGMYGITGMLVLLSYIVAKVYVDDNEIVYKNLIGLKRHISWKEVEYTIDDRNNLIIYGVNKRIKISPGFSEFEILNELVYQRSKDPKYDKD